MELDQSNMSHIGPDGHITQEERLKRYHLKLCMRCGAPGHRAGNRRPKGKGRGKFVAQIDVIEEPDHEAESSELKD